MSHSIVQLLDIMAALRNPEGGCPWDLKQDFHSIVPHTLEEVYEVIDAIERKNRMDLCDELGDLLFQVIYYARLAEEEGSFDFTDVIAGICDKLVRRHPHVFADAECRTAKQQSQAWEAQKQQEREARSASGSASVMDDVSLSLPALTRARKLQKRAATVGFDWQNIAPVMAKMREEIEELEAELEAPSGKVEQQRLVDELGDVLFTMVNLARHLDVDPETALRGSAQKFERRFRYLEAALLAEGKNPAAVSLEEMDALWDQAKRQELP